jgi:A/G-specific adenine glycosylase
MKFARRLLAWSKVHGREFPWRNTKDPYTIWLAEALLQRTRADIVADQFQTIVKEFPDIDSLRKASQGKIRRAIRRLGLVHRASYLRDAAIFVTSQFGGNFPCKTSLLKEVPGTGDYIASALALFAYNEREFPIDVNVVRVIGRAFGVNSPTKRPTTDKTFRSLLERMVPKRQEKRFMYGVLDLAAQICIDNRRVPKCNLCPVSGVCDWYANNTKGRQTTSGDDGG